MSDLLDNILNDAENKPVSSDAMKQISELAETQVQLEDYITTSEKELADLKVQLYKVQQELLPEALLAIGMTSFTLKDGSTISCGKVYQAHISKANAEEAHKWLRDNGHGDIIKNEVKVNFGKDQDVEANAFKEQLNKDGQTYTAKEPVHASTLKSFVRGELESGRQVHDSLGVHLTTVSKVTRRN